MSQQKLFGGAGIITCEVYIQSMKSWHTNFSWFCSGLIINEGHNFLAMQLCHDGDGVVEIKWPFSKRDFDTRDALKMSLCVYRPPILLSNTNPIICNWSQLCCLHFSPV